MSLDALAAELQLGAAVSAVLLARRQPGHRPVALLLASTTAATAARVALVARVIAPARARIEATGLDPAAVPFQGVAALACHLDAGLWLTWPAGIAGAAGVVFQGWRPRPVALAWLACSMAIAAAYPLTRGAVLASCYRAAALAAVVALVLALAAWIPRRRSFEASHLTMMVIGAIEVAGLVAGAWSADPFTRWELTQAQLVAGYVVIVAVQGVAWLAP